MLPSLCGRVRARLAVRLEGNAVAPLVFGCCTPPKIYSVYTRLRGQNVFVYCARSSSCYTPTSLHSVEQHSQLTTNVRIIDAGGPVLDSEYAFILSNKPIDTCFSVLSTSSPCLTLTTLYLIRYIYIILKTLLNTQSVL